MKEDRSKDLKTKVEDIPGRKSFNRFDRNLAETSELSRRLRLAEDCSQEAIQEARDIKSTSEGELTKHKFSS